MRTFVISAFPACGKSYCVENYSRHFSMLDSDSSEFSWVKDENGNNTKERNPNFPQNYIDHIKRNIGKVNIIFVSSHEVVRKALIESDIRFILVYPHKSHKEEWLRRFKARGNNEVFINFISSNWDNFIDDMDNIDASIGEINNNGLIYRNISKMVLNPLGYLTYEYLRGLTDNSMGNLNSMLEN